MNRPLSMKLPGVLSALTLAAAGCGYRSALPVLVELTAQASPGGTVVSTPAGVYCGALCRVPFPQGAPVTLTAVPEVGAEFEGWSGACAGADPVCTVPMLEATAVQARFRFLVEVSPAGSGSGTVASTEVPLDCGAACTAGATPGSAVTLTATPASGSAFAGWSGDCTGRGACSLAMDRPRRVTATFTHGAVGWARVFGSTDDDRVTGLAVSADGQVTMAGHYSGTMALGTGPLVGQGGQDIFVARYAADGTPRWSRRAGGTGYEYVERLAVSGTGDVFVVGGYSTLVGTNLGGADLPLVGTQDGFVAKYDGQTGAHLWSMRLGGPGTDRVYAVAVDPAGDVVVLGEFDQSIDLGAGAGQELVGHGTSRDAFLAKFSGATGAHRWSRVLGGTYDDAARGLAVNAAGDVLVAGTFSGTTLDLGAVTPLVSRGGSDIFVARFAGTDGAYQWGKAFGGWTDDRATGLALDRAGDVFVTGSFAATPQFGASSNDLLVLKVAGRDGATQWLRGYGATTADEAGASITVDAAGDAWVAGSFGKAAGDVGNLGPGPLLCLGSRDMLLAKFSGATGDVRATWALGGAGADDATGIAASLTAGQVYFIGTWGDRVSFGADPLTSTGYADGVLASFSE